MKYTYANTGHPCQATWEIEPGIAGVCGKRDDQKPMCFRGTPWCSDQHRKLLLAEKPDAKIDGEI